MSGPQSNVKSSQPSKPVRTSNAQKAYRAEASLLKKILKQRGAMQSVEKGYRQQRREHLARAVELGFRLTTAPQSTWDRFVSHSLWGNRKPKSPKQSEAVRCVVLWLYASDKRADKQSSDVWRAVKHLLGEAKTPAEIVDTIKNGRSIRALCDKASQHSKQASDSKATTSGASAQSTGKPASVDDERGTSSPAKQKRAPDRARGVGGSPSGKAEATPSSSTPAEATSTVNAGTGSIPHSKMSGATLIATLRLKKKAGALLNMPKDARVRIDAVIENMNGGCVLHVKSCRRRPEKSTSTAAPVR